MNYNKCLTNARLIGAGMAIGVYISSAAIAQAQTAKVLCLGVMQNKPIRYPAPGAESGDRKIAT